MKRQADDWIIEQLSSVHQSDRDDGMLYIYNKIFSQVGAWMRKNKAESADIEDILQDSLIVLYKLVRNGDINKVQNIEAYLFKVCKNLWLRRLQRNRKETTINELNIEIPDAAKGLLALEDSEQKDALHTLIEQLGA